jgi:hypothetical protein
MTENDTKKYPAPVYAAAGTADLAYQQLRKLPSKVVELRERVGTGDRDLRLDVEKLRTAARRNAAAVRVGAQQAQERAAALYGDLVARGEKVVRGVQPPVKATATVETTPPSQLETEAK